MKRTSFESLKAFPYSPGDTVDRLGFLSATLGIQVQQPEDADPDSKLETGVRVTVTHSDEETGTFENVLDERLFLDESRKKYSAEESERLEEVFFKAPAAAGDLMNLDIDLVGCKQFVKINVGYTGEIDGACVLVLGDGTKVPV